MVYHIRCNSHIHFGPSVVYLRTMQSMKWNLADITATRKTVDKKIDQFCKTGEIYVTTLQREFGILFTMARDIMLVLLEADIVKEVDDKYQIIDKAAFKTSLSNIITLLKVNFGIQSLQEQVLSSGNQDGTLN